MRRLALAVALGLTACGTPSTDPCAAITIEVAPTMRIQSWAPDEDPSASTPIRIDGPASCAVEVTSDSPWLVGGVAGDVLSAGADPSEGPGLHRGTLALSSGGIVLETVEVEFSVFGRASGSGEPHVLVVGIDGCRPDAVMAADTPSIDALSSLGRATYTASTQLTAGTISGPGWASILTGVEAEDHLVESNDDLADVALAAHPTFLFRARAAGLDVFVHAQWPGIVSLVEPELAAAARVGTGERVARDAAGRIALGSDVVFTHFDDVDHAGHATGFSPTNPDYVAAIESVDAHVATMVDAILARPTLRAERWLVAITTDHGGSGTSHGALDAENRTIFVVLTDFAGAPAFLPATGVSHMDVAPSVLEHLGVAVDPAWMLDGVTR